MFVGPAAECVANLDSEDANLEAGLVVSAPVASAVAPLPGAKLREPMDESMEGKEEMGDERWRSSLEAET